MSPSTFLAMILNRAAATALGAFNVMIDRPLHVDLDEFVFHSQVNIGDEPWWNEAQ